LEEIIFENFKIFENNIISVELAKVLGCILKKKFQFCGDEWTLDHLQEDLPKVVTDESRSFLEPRYFGDILEPVLKLGISSAFPRNIATLGHFPLKHSFAGVAARPFFSVTQWRKFITKQTGQAGHLNIYQIHFAFNSPN